MRQQSRAKIEEQSADFRKRLAAIESNVHTFTQLVLENDQLRAQLGDLHEIAQPPPRYLFRDRGAIYEVRFEGESGTIDARLAGAKHISELLQHPHAFYEATDLCGAVASVDSGQTDQNEAKEPLRKCKERLADIDTALDEAKEQYNTVDIDLLERERGQILAEVGRLAGLGGAVRRATPNESSRIAVRGRIRRVITNCREKYNLPRFAEHLDRSIETGNQCAYRPADPAPAWHF
jgi:hypothetical protein